MAAVVCTDDRVGVPLECRVDRDSLLHRQQRGQLSHQIGRRTYRYSTILLGLRFSIHHGPGFQLVRVLLRECLQLTVADAVERRRIRADPSVDLLARFAGEVGSLANQDCGTPFRQPTRRQRVACVGHLVLDRPREPEILRPLLRRGFSRNSDLSRQSPALPGFRYSTLLFIGATEFIQPRRLTRLCCGTGGFDLFQNGEPSGGIGFGLGGRHLTERRNQRFQIAGFCEHETPGRRRMFVLDYLESGGVAGIFDREGDGASTSRSSDHSFVSAARNIASVPCRWGQSCTCGPSPISSVPTSGRASSWRASGTSSRTEATSSVVSAGCGEHVE